VEVGPRRKSLLFIVQSYLHRWQMEETFRLAKQTYGVEDIRLRKYTRLQNMIALVLAAIYFLTVWLGEGLKLRILVHHTLTAAKTPLCHPRFPVLRCRGRDQIESGGL